MNLPNKLTMFRVFMIPFFVIFMLVNVTGEYDKYIAVAIFIIASLTDMLDGKIARKYNLVTNFGKFMDPLADKLLVCSALICLIGDKLQAWIVIVIISRELIISGFRTIAADNGVVIAASWWGKYKTTSQMLMIIIMIVNLNYSWYGTLEYVFIYLSLVLTIISLVDYLVKNRQVLVDGSTGK
ncbi:CDP-diacylglycerol--glycerol-3-phosphate 3-phosphatidyltransferase [Bovifimicola ammoniilytica]|jgi:CDP-diacylglycerol--glycerol-3-phosphate 3-phosphatidyltransferase|uniref:CDP-diacylglycerol--glycerol-3-phosphate 3-phosphatidyltransferase n=1 Tax=Bovifimicola ammoniilytica TaxID=2981720 RepID=UPI0003382FAC|nr:CDP-diacylglycerol--glycerol-3-phosphate 3-phosphatidyltransferase [Bovifimicola ammoniilytica]MCU6752547.1 CDP-diacylglycerol--glycerol-3-phosphate 3-phosphatidyltransferase [Bovifimicola ammoniilytica]CCZ04705.1 cDP-diacylglycerol--glycerol-3-phosphate 3-phosphatidyltransferase [Eubacterium sp. CAG:603]SCJ28555.1 CDP-diacylglycerol--glycerol-3-phosphate 3-phosphatidyltransferase [uncultured Eubacterium sp.]